MKVPVAATMKRTERPKVLRRCLGALGGGGGGVPEEEEEAGVTLAAEPTGVGAGVILGATLMVEVVPAGRGVEESWEEGGGLRAVSLVISGFCNLRALLVVNCRWTGFAEARIER